MTLEERKEKRRVINREAMRRWRLRNPDAGKKDYQKRKSDPAYVERLRRNNIEFRKKHPEYANEWYSKNKSLYHAAYQKWKYGLTGDRYSRMLEKSGGRCFSCGDKFTDKNKPQIDHCHGTKIVRGLLCKRCNIAEGMLGTVERARKLYEYMLKNDLFYQGKN